MTREDVSNEQLMRAAAAEYMAGGPGSAELWTSIRGRLVTQNCQTAAGPWYGAARRGVAVAVVTVASAFAGGFVALAARGTVPFIDHQSTPAITVTDSGVVGVSPAPTFHILNPGYVPSNLTIHTFAVIPGHQPGEKPGWTAIASTRSTTPPSPCPSPVSPTVELRGRGSETVWMRFAASTPGGEYIQIVEQASTPNVTQSEGVVTPVNNADVTVQQDGAETVLGLTQVDTAITIRTNLDRTQALKVADSLH